MGLFDLFGKKPSTKSPSNLDLGLLALQKGGYVDFDLETYKVEKRSCYEEEGERSLEWHLVGQKNNQHIFLGQTKDDGREYWLVTRKIANSAVNKSQWQDIKNDDAPSKISLEGVEFHGDSSGACYFYPDDKGSDRQEMIYWTYEDSAGDQLLTIEQWGESEFEVYLGKYVEETDFYNIIQG